MKIKLDKKIISKNSKPYFIAEISGNHNGKIENAIKIIHLAKEIGADAVKLQTYTSDTMTLNSQKKEFMIKDGLWQGYSLFELYQLAHTPWEWHEELFEEAKKIDITIFSTPFDKTAIDLLEKLGTPFYKVASFEITDLNLIDLIGKTKKPVILSTGMASKEEIKKAIKILDKNGSNDVILLHCISGYPTPITESNLLTIPKLASEFNKIVGLSDHTQSSIAAIAACSIGAKVVEKHIIFDRSEGGVDSEFSLEPMEFKEMIDSCTKAYEALGVGSFELKPSEKNNIIFRRSVYASKDIKRGEFLTSKNIKIIRPGFGIEPERYNELLNGYRAKKNIEFGTALNWKLIEI